MTLPAHRDHSKCFALGNKGAVLAIETVDIDQMRQHIGYQTSPVAVEIDNSLVKRFAEGVEDPNPRWQDEEEASRGRFGGIVAPPSLLCAAFLVGDLPLDPIASMLPSRMLDGGGEWELLEPVRPGDTITIVNRLADVTERQGRVGSMVLVSMESTWQNQRHDVVAKARFTLIRY